MRYEIDVAKLVEDYRNGKSGTELARELGVSPIVVYKRLADSGVEMRTSGPLTAAFDEDALVAAYIAGRSENAVAKSAGVSRSVVRRILIHRGVRIRNQSEAEALRWQQMTPDQRARQVASAHEAARGTTHTFEHRCRIAQTRETRASGRSPGELRLARMLAAHGIDTIAQQAIGPYNCDLGASPVAVEVWGGHWHWHGRHIARVEERFRYILNAGWHLLVLPISRDDPLTDAVADYVADYIENARAHLGRKREYRIAWSAGRFITAGFADDLAINVAPPFGVGKQIARRSLVQS